MGRWNTGRGGGHWGLAAASIAAEVTVIQVPVLWAFPTQCVCVYGGDKGVCWGGAWVSGVSSPWGLS